MRRLDPVTGIAGDILSIREFALSDFSQLAEYNVPGIGRGSFSLDVEYVPQLDAYAVTDWTFSTYFIRGKISGPIPRILLERTPWENLLLCTQYNWNGVGDSGFIFLPLVLK